MGDQGNWGEEGKDPGRGSEGYFGRALRLGEAQGRPLLLSDCEGPLRAL